MSSWECFKDLCRLRFGPPIHGSRLAELGRLPFVSMVQDFVDLGMPRPELVFALARRTLRWWPPGSHSGGRGAARPTGPADGHVLCPGVRASSGRHAADATAPGRSTSAPPSTTAGASAGWSPGRAQPGPGGEPPLSPSPAGRAAGAPPPGAMLQLRRALCSRACVPAALLLVVRGLHRRGRAGGRRSGRSCGSGGGGRTGAGTN